MALYVYRCPTCLEVFELRRAMDDRDKPVVCPKCRQARVTTRLLTKPAGIIIR